MLSLSIVSFPSAFILAITLLNSFSPWANVFMYLSFSWIITSFISSFLLTSSGYISFNISTSKSINPDNSFRSISNLFKCLVILRINLLKIYPLSILLGLPPSAIIIILALKCSATILLLAISSFLASSNNLSIIGLNISVSKGVSFPCNSIAILSNPRPVSTFLCVNFEYFPSFFKYSMKTLFHISTYFPQSHDGWQSGPQAGFPVS